MFESRSADGDVFLSCSILLLGAGPPPFRFQTSHGGLAEHCTLDALAKRTHGEEESHRQRRVDREADLEAAVVGARSQGAYRSWIKRCGLVEQCSGVEFGAKKGAIPEQDSSSILEVEAAQGRGEGGAG